MFPVYEYHLIFWWLKVIFNVNGQFEDQIWENMFFSKYKK